MLSAAISISSKISQSIPDSVSASSNINQVERASVVDAISNLAKLVKFKEAQQNLEIKTQNILVKVNKIILLML